MINRLQIIVLDMIVAVFFAVACLAQAPKVIVSVVPLVPVYVMHFQLMPGTARTALPASLLFDCLSHSAPVRCISGWRMRGSEA